MLQAMSSDSPIEQPGIAADDLQKTMNPSQLDCSQTVAGESNTDQQSQMEGIDQPLNKNSSNQPSTDPNDQSLTGQKDNTPLPTAQTDFHTLSLGQKCDSQLPADHPNVHNAPNDLSQASISQDEFSTTTAQKEDIDGQHSCLDGTGQSQERESGQQSIEPKVYPGRAVQTELKGQSSNLPVNMINRSSSTERQPSSRSGLREGFEPKKGIDSKWNTNDDDDEEEEEEEDKAQWRQRESENTNSNINSKHEAEKKYNFFWLTESPFSQWHKSNFNVDGNTFNCAEQYMMYAKAKLFLDEHSADEILRTKNPRKMKGIGRKVKNFNETMWQLSCLEIVKMGNIAKFSQNKHLREKLFETYPNVLVEASPYDAVWGIGLAEDHPLAWSEDTWEGKNLLGYILTEVRDELLFDKGFITAASDKKVYLKYLQGKLDQRAKLM